MRRMPEARCQESIASEELFTHPWLRPRHLKRFFLQTPFPGVLQDSVACL
jgi:hypothetical protein